MPGLPQPVLRSKLRAALPTRTRFDNDQSTRPADLTVPGFGAARIYLWTVTTVRSPDRPPSEYKIEMILPNQARGERGQLDLLGKPTFLLGYSPDFGVFVGWEASKHSDFAWSATVQINEATLEEARATGWAVAPPRQVRAGPEVSVAFSPANLRHFMSVATEADEAGTFGAARELYYLLRTPNEAIEEPAVEEDASAAASRLRGEVLVRRKIRDATFRPLVIAQYGCACAICGTQLDIVEGAHIIPVHVVNSTDDMWNGLALCPNHHQLFDAYLLTVTASLKIRIDGPRLEYLRGAGLGAGAEELLEAFENSDLREPAFFATDRRARARMLEALGWHAATAATG